MTGFPAIFSMYKYPPQHIRSCSPSLKYTNTTADHLPARYNWVSCYILHVRIPPPTHTFSLTPCQIHPYHTRPFTCDISRVPCYDLHAEVHPDIHPPTHTLLPSLKYTRNTADHLPVRYNWVPCYDLYVKIPPPTHTWSRILSQIYPIPHHVPVRHK